MPDIAASVLARLKAKSRQTGQNYQLCLQLFAQEEFIRKIENSKYADNFILKGGLLLYSLSRYEGRPTTDIDFLLKDISNNLDNIVDIVSDIIHTDTGNDYIQFEIKSVKRIALIKKYPGVGFNIVANIKNTKTPFGLDIGIGDVVVPDYVRQKIPTQIKGFKTPEIRTYSLESIIAEKLDAILSMMELGSRMKDYYDIYYLSKEFNFNGIILQKAIRETFTNRERVFTIDLLQQVILFRKNKAMINKWNAFMKRVDIEQVDFNDILLIIDVFLGELYVSIMNDTVYDKQWTSINESWA